MITILCSTFLRYKGAIDAEVLLLLILLGGLSELMVELIALCVVIGK